MRLSHEPRYWLYRDRFVLQEGVESEPDEFVDLLETLTMQGAEAASDWSRGSDPHERGAKQLEQMLSQAGIPRRWQRLDLRNMVMRASRGILPTRHSDLAARASEEMVLRIKHAVLTEERSLEKLRREVEAFENFQKVGGTQREPIPSHIQMFGRVVRLETEDQINTLFAGL